jgi:hypothetical protein
MAMPSTAVAAELTSRKRVEKCMLTKYDLGKGE